MISISPTCAPDTMVELRTPPPSGGRAGQGPDAWALGHAQAGERACYLLAVVLAIPASAPAQASPPLKPEAAAGVTAFVNVHVVPMDSARVLTDQTVLVENGRIRAVGPASQVPIPAGAVRIDGREKYLMPGLTDMHAHLHPAFYATGDRYLQFQNPQDTTLADLWLSLFVANGVTTVRNMDYLPDGGRSLRLRAQAAAGADWLPRIYTAGAWAGRELVSSERMNGLAPESVATYLTTYQAAGYDFIKVRNEQGPIFDSVAAIAQRLGLPIAGHLNREKQLESVLESKVYASIEHLDGYHSLRPRGVMWERLIAQIPARVAMTRRVGVWNVPHMTLFEVRAEEVDPLTWPELRYLTMREYRKSAEQMQQANQSQTSDTTDAVLQVRRHIIQALTAAGAGLMLGSDTPLHPLVPGFATHRDLQALVRAGLTPYQALAMATKNVGMFFQEWRADPLRDIGTIAVGKLADLVLLHGNPLEDIRHTMAVAGVMRGGRWLSPDAIGQRLTVLPYWQFPGPDIEEQALLRRGITLTATQEQAFDSLQTGQRARWRTLIDSLRTSGQDRAIALDSAGSARLLQLAAQQFGEYRAGVLTPAQRGAFDATARLWMTATRRYGFRAAIPDVKE